MATRRPLRSQRCALPMLPWQMSSPRTGKSHWSCASWPSREQLHVPGRAARNGADGGVQDTTQHLHDRAGTHESSNVQGVQEGGGQGGASHRDSR
eukprot:3624241-Prymnesium_polylepis.1